MTQRLLGGALLVACWCGPVCAQTFTLLNHHPQIQMYYYPQATSNGAGSVRDRAPTFGNYAEVHPQTQQVVYPPRGGVSPARNGSMVFAADTSAVVPVGLDPGRYRIDALRVTSTLIGSLIIPQIGLNLPYDNTVDDPAALTTAGGDDPGYPVELYGLGLQGDYARVSFDPQDADPAAYQLRDPRWRPYRVDEAGYNPADPGAWAPYQTYGVDAQGRDVENSVVGGYSATAPGHTTAPFTPSPFGVGRVYDAPGVERAAGAPLAYGDTFVFEPNLADAGVVAYLQQALAAGALGFSLSSLHPTDGQSSSTPYPDFYLDDWDVGVNPAGQAPTIELVVTVLDAATPQGDYDGDGRVTAADYVVWRDTLGSTTELAADGDGNLSIGEGDYTAWVQAFGSPAAAAGAVMVPEPGAWTLGLVTVLAAGWGGSGPLTTHPRSRP